MQNLIRRFYFLPLDFSCRLHGYASRMAACAQVLGKYSEFLVYSKNTCMIGWKMSNVEQKMTQHFSGTTLLLSDLWQQNFSKGKFVAKQAFTLNWVVAFLNQNQHFVLVSVVTINLIHTWSIYVPTNCIGPLSRPGYLKIEPPKRTGNGPPCDWPKPLKSSYSCSGLWCQRQYAKLSSDYKPRWGPSLKWSRACFLLESCINIRLEITSHNNPDRPIHGLFCNYSCPIIKLSQLNWVRTSQVFELCLLFTKGLNNLSNKASIFFLLICACLLPT